MAEAVLALCMFGLIVTTVVGAIISRSVAEGERQQWMRVPNKPRLHVVIRPVVYDFESEQQ